ncbi:MAG: SMI1/KNR4 family protein [Gemmataceae bacterium]
MPNEVDKVKGEFPNATYGPPCSDADIERATAAMGEPLPAVLEEYYRAFNGFRGPTNAGFFWQLFTSNENPTGLVEMNKFLRENANDLFLYEIVSQCLFFGDDGVGAQWAFKKDLPAKIIKWDARWGSDIEIVGASPLEAWLAEKEFYDQVEQDET